MIRDMLNCTPHPIKFYSEDGQRELYELGPSGWVVRIQTPAQAPLESKLFWEDQCHPDCWCPIVTPQNFSASPVMGLPPVLPPSGKPLDPDGRGLDRGDESWWHAEKQGLSAPPIIVGFLGAERVAQIWPGPVYTTDTGPASVVRAADDTILGIRRLQLISRGRR